MVVYGQKSLYSGKSGSIRAKRFNSRKTGCNWLKLLYSCKSCSVRALVVFFGQKWWSSSKVVLLQQNGCINRCNLAIRLKSL